MQNNIKPKFLRAKEIAKYFGIGESTVWYYVKHGRIRSIKASPKVTIFDVAEVEKALFLQR